MAVLNTIITTYFPQLCMSATSSSPRANSLEPKPTPHIHPENSARSNFVQHPFRSDKNDTNQKQKPQIMK